MTPAVRLAGAMRKLTTEQRNALVAYGVEARIILRASRARPINANDYLRIASLTGVDPLTGVATDVGKDIGPLHYPSLSAALRMKRIQAELNLRWAAKRAKISYSAMGRIERGEAVSIDAIMAACKWLGRHPFEFVSPAVETRSAA